MALPVRVSRQNQQLEPFASFRRGVPDLFDRFFGVPGNWLSEWMGSNDFGSMGIDVREDADHLYVEADLPGFNKDEVDISIDNGMLSIMAEHREQQPSGEQKKEEGNYLLRERRYERLQRSISLPQGIDEQNVNAKLENGCLTVTLNKTERAKARKIPLA